VARFIARCRAEQIQAQDAEPLQLGFMRLQFCNGGVPFHDRSIAGVAALLQRSLPASRPAPTPSPAARSGAAQGKLKPGLPLFVGGEDCFCTRHGGNGVDDGVLARPGILAAGIRAYIADDFRHEIATSSYRARRRGHQAHLWGVAAQSG